MRYAVWVIPMVLARCAGAPNPTPPTHAAESKLDEGFQAIQGGEHAKAVEQLSEAIRISPEFAEAYYYRGACLAQMGRDQEALADFDSALRYRPDHRMALYNGALIAARHGEDSSVIVATSRMLEIDPRDVPAYLLRGDAYRRRGNFDDAVRDYYEGMEIDRTYVVSHGDPALVKYMTDNAAALRRALGTCPAPRAGHGYGRHVRSRQEQDGRPIFPNANRFR